MPFSTPPAPSEPPNSRILTPLTGKANNPLAEANAMAGLLRAGSLKAAKLGLPLTAACGGLRVARLPAPRRFPSGVNRASRESAPRVNPAYAAVLRHRRSAPQRRVLAPRLRSIAN